MPKNLNCQAIFFLVASPVLNTHFDPHKNENTHFGSHKYWYAHFGPRKYENTFNLRYKRSLHKYTC